jgi:hypothetical protein
MITIDVSGLKRVAVATRANSRYYFFRFIYAVLLAELGFDATIVDNLSSALSGNSG